VYKQLAQGHYLTLHQPWVKTATSGLQIQQTTTTPSSRSSSSSSSSRSSSSSLRQDTDISTHQLSHKQLETDKQIQRRTETDKTDAPATQKKQKRKHQHTKLLVPDD